MAADSVGCATPISSAARPKCFSLARAMNISSLSIMDRRPASVMRREKRPARGASISGISYAMRHKQKAPC
jgi:hypothetical protein